MASFSLPSPPPPLQFIISPSQGLLSGFLRLAANNAGVVWYHRLPQGVEAAERLSSKSKHLYSVICLIVIPHSSVPLPAASLSIIHLTLIYSTSLSVRGHLPKYLQPGETCAYCVYVHSTCVLVLFLMWIWRWFRSWDNKGTSSQVWQGLKEKEPGSGESMSLSCLSPAFSSFVPLAGFLIVS